MRQNGRARLCTSGGSRSVASVPRLPGSVAIGTERERVENANLVREFLRQRLEARGDRGSFKDDDSLLISGRLDSMDAMQIILFLEEQLGVDFAGLDFSLELIDRPLDVLALADHQMPR